MFYGNPATIYYLSGTTNWGTMLNGHPSVLWNPPVPFNYSTNSGTIAITQYTGSNSIETIPNTINFLPVTSIGERAFEFCPGLENVNIPGSATNIGDYAFFSCSGLINVSLSNGVSSLGADVFA